LFFFFFFFLLCKLSVLLNNHKITSTTIQQKSKKKTQNIPNSSDHIGKINSNLTRSSYDTSNKPKNPVNANNRRVHSSGTLERQSVKKKALHTGPALPSVWAGDRPKQMQPLKQIFRCLLENSSCLNFIADVQQRTVTKNRCTSPKVMSWNVRIECF